MFNNGNFSDQGDVLHLWKLTFGEKVPELCGTFNGYDGTEQLWFGPLASENWKLNNFKSHIKSEEGKPSKK